MVLINTTIVSHQFPPLTHLAHLVTHFSTALPRPQLILLRLCVPYLCLCAFCPQRECSSNEKARESVQQNSSRWNWRMFCVCSSFRKLFVSQNNCRGNTFSTFFISLGINSAFAVESQRERKTYTHCTGPTHCSHMPAIRGHTHVHAHPHTRVCPIQCTVALNDCGMDFAEILDLF